mmetsp:Transcript_21102/g.32366  ORF Transcript_21102/g.32366 Transcript_21102/m.32366 type:complete len:144 (-) Transcript_21102:74-505(-)
MAFRRQQQKDVDPRENIGYPLSESSTSTETNQTTSFLSSMKKFPIPLLKREEKTTGANRIDIDDITSIYPIVEVSMNDNDYDKPTCNDSPRSIAASQVTVENDLLAPIYEREQEKESIFFDNTRTTRRRRTTTRYYKNTSHYM